MDRAKYYEISIHDRKSHKIFLNIRIVADNPDRIEIINCVEEYDWVSERYHIMPSLLASHGAIKKITKEDYENHKKILENKVEVYAE